VLLAGLALMVLAWLATTPLGTAADEPDHYIKALAAGRGDLRGHAPRADPTDPIAAVLAQQGGEGEAQLRAVRWVAAGARTFTLPTALVPTAIDCFNNLFRRADTKIPANCVTHVSLAPGEQRFLSYEAVNPPYLYVFPGAAMRLAGDRSLIRAYRFGRAGMALMCLILFGLALLLLWDREAGPLSLVGAMVATTPTSVWSFSVINPSGLEIAGATCWAAALLRLLRRPEPPGWVWAAAAAGGVALATARSSGPMILVLIPVCIGLVFGFGRLLSATRRLGRGLVPVAVCLALAVAAAIFWLRYIPDYPVGTVMFDFIGDAIRGVPRTLHEATGRFAGDYFIPVYLVAAWGALLAALLVAAALVATPRERVRLALVTVAVVIFLVAYSTAFLTNGFPEFQGRYALPVLLSVPLCAGWILVERRSRIPVSVRTPLVVGFTLGTVTIQLLAWWLEARRLAVGTDGPFFFLGDTAWDPAGGWPLWALAMLAGTALYASVVLPRIRKARSVE
jgi:Predicted membrane protein (DUF2142)